MSPSLGPKKPVLDRMICRLGSQTQPVLRVSNSDLGNNSTHSAWNSCVVQKHKKCAGSGDLEQRHLTSPRLSFVWKKNWTWSLFIKRVIDIQKQVCQPELCLMTYFLYRSAAQLLVFLGGRGRTPFFNLCLAFPLYCSMLPIPGVVCYCSGLWAYLP